MLGNMQGGQDRVPYMEENLWGYGKRLRFVEDAVQRAFPGTPRGKLTILDIGCGNGSQLAIPLAHAGYRVTGIDPHEPSIQRGRSFGSAVCFLHGTLDMLPTQPLIASFSPRYSNILRGRRRCLPPRCLISSKVACSL